MNIYGKLQGKPNWNRISKYLVKNMSFEAFFKGWLGEQGTRLAQKLTLDSKQYHTFYDILIQMGSSSRSTQIDHVIVSKYGVFVVETKNRRGWIFGSKNDKLWTRNFFGNKVRFQNPLHQNYAHTQSIAEFCQIDHSKIHSIVVFWGDCTFKTQMPENVVKWSEYPGHIKSKKQVILTDDEVDRICNQLSTLKGHIPILSNLIHAQSIKNQYNNTAICPKCGGKLLERTARIGKRAGQKFVGCENYPRCRYKKEL